MATKKSDSKKKGDKEKDPEKEAKRKARQEALKNRPNVLWADPACDREKQSARCRYLDVLQVDFQDLLRRADRNQHLEYCHGYLLSLIHI